MLPIRTRRCTWCLLSGTVIVGMIACNWAAPAAAQLLGGLGQSSGATAATAANPPAAATELPPPVPPLAQIQRGKELFKHQWTAGDSQAKTGDGLGPMFNARSCANCHNQGQVGGAGSADHNVDLLSIEMPKFKERIDPALLRTHMTNFHPAFTAGTNSVRRFITLHHFGTNEDYAEWRDKLIALVTPDTGHKNPLPLPVSRNARHSAAKHDPAPTVISGADIAKKASTITGGISFRITQRNTPALFGVGLIDKIPDDVIRRAAADQAKHRGSIHGKVALAGSGGVGKFGWRGQTATLKEFVMGTCANELGLQVPANDQPLDPLNPSGKSPGLDLTQEQCDDLTVYVDSLGRPEQVEILGKETERVTTGARLFNKAGCANCHMERLGNVTGIYSDLLLHDMGAPLSDPVPGNSASMRGFGLGPSSGAGYYGGTAATDVFVDAPPESFREWRTPPLWGVGDSAPYLHDGRAATLHDAIMAHAGEATNARRNYAALPTSARNKIVAFLNSLKAPR